MFLIQGYSAGLLHLFMVKTAILFDQDLGELVISCQLVMAHPYVSDRSKHVTVEKRRITVCTVEYELGNSVDQKLIINLHC